MTRSFVAAQRRVAGEHLRQFAHLAGATPQERTLLALLAQRGRYEGASHLEIADLARRALSEGALFDDAAPGEGLVGWVHAMMSLITADALPEARTEIDRALTRVVSPKTVENHLGRVYTKLGIANRRELAGALG